jgi:hypothetical protein
MGARRLHVTDLARIRMEFRQKSRGRISGRKASILERESK